MELGNTSTQKSQIPVLDKTLITLSDFVESAFKMPEGGTLQPISFNGRRYLRRLYDTPAQRTILMCGRQVEKCLVLGTYVSKYNGSLEVLDTLSIGDHLCCMQNGSNARTGTGAITWKSEPILRPVVIVRTRQGHTITGGWHHPIRTLLGWKELIDVDVGTRLAVCRKIGVFEGKPQSETRIKLTGYIIGDGSIDGHSIGFTQVPGKVLDEVHTLCSAIGTFTTYQYPGRKSVETRIKSDQLKDWLREDGLLGTKSATKFIPSWVFELPREQTALFINRLWSTDGHVKKNGPSKYSLEYCSMSEHLVRQLQALLWKFGIPSRIRKNWPNIYKKRGEEKYAYILRVETQEGVRQFLSEIGAYGKSEGIPAPDLDSNSNRDTLPIEINAEIRALLDTTDLHQSPRAAGLRRKLKYAPTISKLREYIELLEESGVPQDRLSGLKEHLDSDIYWDVVESVEYLGERLCMDLTVDPHNNFIANGIVTHNSTSLGNKLISTASLLSYKKLLYVAPRQDQTRTFSKDRLKQPLMWSDAIGKLQVNRGSMDNTFYKEFATGSVITLRWALLSADAIRGIMTDFLFIDEIQNILATVIPVIEECAFHSENPSFHYAGTPLTESNTLSAIHRKYSTQNEWLIPCDSCGGGDYRYWNMVGEENIGKEHLVCAKCGSQIYPMHPDADWVAMNPKPATAIPFEGFRIPQLITPMVRWPSLLDKMARYPRAQFLNEVLGIPYDVGSRPITEAELRACCDPQISMYNDSFKIGPKWWETSPQAKYFGVDWGTGERSYTVLTASTYVNDKLTFLYFKRFEGELSEPPRQIAEIETTYRRFKNVAVIATDYGGGFDRNDTLLRTFGPRMVVKYQYTGANKMVAWDDKLLRYILNRTEVMSMYFNAIKNRSIVFPRWEEFQPFAEDFMNIYTEWREERNTLVYDKIVDGTDDAYHSSLYSVLGSMISHPRPDLLHGGYAYTQK